MSNPSPHIIIQTKDTSILDSISKKTSCYQHLVHPYISIHSVQRFLHLSELRAGEHFLLPLNNHY